VIGDNDDEFVMIIIIIVNGDIDFMSVAKVIVL